MVEMDLYDDSSERITYSSPNLPLYSDRTRLKDYPNCAAPSHWHDDIEFIVVLWGELNYNVNGEVYVLREGDGIFVNSRQLHFGYSVEKKDCEFICVLLHPIMLCSSSYMERTYVAPVTRNSNLPYKRLSREIQWEKEVLDAVVIIHGENMEREPGYPLAVMSRFFGIWRLLYEHAPKKEGAKKESLHQLSTLKDMVGFIQTHYRRKIILSDIAAAGGVCKSSCSRIFRDYLHQTPINYLTEYRIDKSMELLRNTEMNISEISYATGFSGASYFAETFRELLLITPSEYRNKSKKHPMK